MTAPDYEPLSCRTCRWAEATVLEDGPVIECRRFPPQLVVPEEGDVLQAWPQVTDQDWCGEHASRLDGAP